jgi:tetratricopeptide (TPR) repeat protein
VVIATLAVYGPVRGFAFVNYDDNAFILDNLRMQEGLTLRNLGWAFTVSVAANWHPLTVITHLLDCSLYGLDAGGHHLTNLLLHAANVALLHRLLRRLSLSEGAALLAAALFAVHPLNVESVAWVAERKNVLSTLFLLLALSTYVSYARTRSRRSYAATLVLFTAGLMSKAMLVTVPLLLVLFDLWPLRRASLASAGAALRDLVRLLPEKIPFLVLSLVMSVLTVATQGESGALGGLGGFPIGARLQNAAVSYLAYVGQTLWPVDLSVFYPHPGTKIGGGTSLVAAAVLIGATAVAWRQRTRRPWVLVGWLWYLVTLLPVIGIVQVGAQARADRYAYVPLVGLFLVVASLVEEAGRRSLAGRAAVYAAGALAVLVLSVACRSQVMVWRETRTLFEHALASVDGAYVAHNQLGILDGSERRYGEARKHFEAAIAMHPAYFDGWNNLGQISLEQNDLEGAVRNYQKAIAFRRDNPRTLNNLGTALARLGRHAEAAGFFEEALRLDPAHVNARTNRATSLAALGRDDEALREFELVLRLVPDHPRARSGAEEARRRLANANGPGP